MNTTTSLPNIGQLPSKEELRNSCSILFHHLQKLLKFNVYSITKVGQDIHLIGQLQDGKYVHIRTWIQHMYDCEAHKELVRSGQVFLGGYIRNQKEPTTKVSPQDGEDALDYGVPFFHYGWFKSDANSLFQIIHSAQPTYFQQDTKICEVKKHVDSVLHGKGSTE